MVFIVNDKKQINILVGQNIKREREKAGYTQERFSELIGIGPKSLSAIERGTVGVSLSLLLRITRLLSISTDRILLPEQDKNDIDDLTERMQSLPPQQFMLVRDVVYKLLEAFNISDKTNFHD